MVAEFRFGGGGVVWFGRGCGRGQQPVGGAVSLSSKMDLLIARFGETELDGF